jgi:uncharacterized protein YgiB involved in biofilm formation
MRVPSDTTNSTRAFRSQYMAVLNRRRTRWLAALACTSSALAMLAACDSPLPSNQPQTRTDPAAEQVTVYKTLADCQAVQTDDRICDAAFNEAKEWQGQQPGYASQAQCEGEFGAGRCETRSGNGTSWFVPMMAGFMLSNAMNRMSYNNYMHYQKDRKYRGGGTAYPVYVNNRGFVSTWSRDGTRPLNHRVTGNSLPPTLNLRGNPSGRGYAAPGAYGRDTDARSPYTPKSRGGFGQTASNRGSCCG